MEKLERGNVNLEPIYTFFTEDIFPEDFAYLLDEFMYHYLVMLIQVHSDDRIGVHKDTVDFIYYLKILRDIIPLCDKRS